MTAISVDTSVWVELLRETGSPAHLELRRLLADDAPIVLSEIVLTELLQGATGERAARRIERRLRALPVLELDSPGDFILAAEIRRRARRAGVSLRGGLDCLIAAPCVRSGVTLLHADADFERLASCVPLRAQRA